MSILSISGRSALVAAMTLLPLSAQAATFNLQSPPLALSSAAATNLGARTTVLSDYTVIHTGNKEFKMSDSEVGAIGSNPATSPPSHGIPTFPGYPAPSVGITYDGDVAITNSAGQFDLSNSHVYARPGGGIDCEAAFATCNKSTSNSRFFAEGADASGVPLANNAGAQRDQPSMLAVRNELAGLSAFLLGLGATGTLTGSLNNETLTQSFGSGLHVVDINVGGSDFSINNSSLLFQGAADAFVVLRMTNTKSILASNANILVGGGMGLNNVMFLSQATGDNAFTFNNVYFNGISWWGLSSNLDKGATWNDVKGCGQVIGGAVNFQNVSMSNCAVDVSVIPLPATGWLMLGMMGTFGLVGWRRRKMA
jgi:hypothetical protein